MLKKYSLLKRGYSNSLRINLTIMEFFFIRNKHPSIKKEYEWVNNFSCSMSFFHGASSSCGDIITYLCERSFGLNQQKIDKT